MDRARTPASHRLVIGEGVRENSAIGARSYMMHATVSHLSVHTPQTTRRPVPPRSTAPPHSHSSSRSASRHFRVCASSNVGGEYASGRKRVLVLGGTGFVGSAICQKLLEDGGFDVVSISRRGAPVSDLGWPPAEVCSDVKWMIGDARDPSVARNILKEGGFTAVRAPLLTSPPLRAYRSVSPWVFQLSQRRHGDLPPLTLHVSWVPERRSL